MNHYLFIIPLTPGRLLSDTRKKLQQLAFQSLKMQSYDNWSALVIGEQLPKTAENDNHFIHIDFEGKKEEKLQKATDYIISKNISSNYIIRFDDDDIINPSILQKVKDIDFDIYVDKMQYFWNFETKQISSRTWLWFPNTCIHKTEHALNRYGDFADGSFKKFHKNALLIENDHSRLHKYYKNKNVVFADTNKPVYLRSITSTSITANNNNNYSVYLNRFGNWNKNTLPDFSFLGTELNGKVKQSFYNKIKNVKKEIVTNIFYLKNIK